jgi:DNA-binding response OmpR family regulator
MITGYADKKNDTIEKGADDFVKKAFELAGLGIRVKSILRMRYLNNELEEVMTYVKEFQKNLPKD